MTANIYFEEFPLELIIGNIAHSFGYLSGEFEIDEDGDIQNIWLEDRSGKMIVLPYPHNAKGHAADLWHQLYKQLPLDYSGRIAEEIADIRANRRATAADLRNDQLRDQAWGV
jgi:hypothetical protein